MRHYILKDEHGNYRCTWTTYGRNTAGLASAVARLTKPGLYRLSVIRDGYGGMCYCIGAHVPKGALAEADRLEANARKQNINARTDMPGVQGYEQRANAASGRLHNLKQESLRLVGWLRSQD